MTTYLTVARKSLIFFVLLLITFTIQSQNANLRFEENRGQWNQLINYKADFTQGKIFLLENHINIIIFDSNNRYFHPHFQQEKNNKHEKFTVFSITPLNARTATIKPQNKLIGYTNYFLGNKKSSWQSSVESFQSVIYENIYPNIDWEVSSDGKMPKHSFIVRPNGNTDMIQVLYKGLKDVSIRNNKLILTTNEGIIEEDELLVYQRYNSQVKKIEAEYSLKRTNDGFELSYIIGNYDKTKDLIIDPTLVFCTYSGAHSDNWGMTSCYDKKGYMISGGIVSGGEYPFTEGAYDSTYSDNWDVVITKYDSLGQNLLFSTFLGGQYCEMPHSMVVNNNDEVIIFGTTGSDDFPVLDNAFQKEFKGGSTVNYENGLLFGAGIDIFVSSLSSDGKTLKASTFIGGTQNDGFNYKDYYANSNKTLYDGNDSLYANFGDCARGEIQTDKNNNIYIATCTFSYNFPTTANAYSPTHIGGQDAVVFKLDQSLSSLIYSTYLGGTEDDAAYSIDLDNNGRAYVCGGTVSNDFPTSVNAYNTNFNGGNTDAFLCVLNEEGSDLDASTFFGSSEYDQAFFVRLDNDYNPYIFGQTKAPGSTLIHNAAYSIPNSGQFVAKFTPTLDSLCLSTVFGSGDGMINISPSGFAVDICNRIYCAGWGRIFKSTKSSLGYSTLGTQNLETTSNAYMTETDGMDFYILSLDMNASQLDYATFIGEYDENIYYGNDHVDGGTSRFDRYGNLYLTICASCSGSQGMPTTDNAYSSDNNSTNCNIASIKFSVNKDFAVADFGSSNIGCVNNAIHFYNYSRGTSFEWDFGDNTPISTTQEPTHTYNKGGLYDVRLITHLLDGCRLSDTLTKKILILDNNSDYLDTINTCPGKPVNIGIDNLAVTLQDSVTFSWTPSEMLSDATIINPYAIVFDSTLFRLVINANGCQDTLYRFVAIDTMQSEIPDTLHYCTTPFIYNIENSMQRQLTCSYKRTFEDTLEMINNKSAVIIKDFGNKYLYIRYSIDGCTAMDSIYLQFDGLTFDIITEDPGCLAESTGKATVILQTETENVHYIWSCSDKDTNSIDNLSVGTYFVKVYTDGDTCFSQIDFNILAITSFNIESQITDATCNNICNGSIAVNVSGGEAPYSYIWSNGETKNFINDICSGQYTLTVTDNTGCSDKVTFTVNNSYNIDVQLSTTDNNCPQGCSAVINTDISGGKEPYTYLWNNSQTTKNLTDVCSDDYNLTITDNNGCKQNAYITVGYKDRLQDFSAWADRYEVYDGAEINLYSTYDENFSYFWTPSVYLDTPNKNNTKGKIYETTIFNVLATDTKGCNKSDTVEILVEYIACDESGIFVPNAFSPNNDGKNDVLLVEGKYIESFDFAIYDRWGEKVFHSQDLNTGWDGKFRNSYCAAGVYYYKLEIKCIGGKTYLTKGDITLIR